MQIGDTVRRIEEREFVLAVILEISEDSVFLEYEEGGSGWWPLDCIQEV